MDMKKVWLKHAQNKTYRNIVINKPSNASWNIPLTVYEGKVFIHTNGYLPVPVIRALGVIGQKMNTFYSHDNMDSYDLFAGYLPGSRDKDEKENRAIVLSQKDVDYLLELGK